MKKILGKKLLLLTLPLCLLVASCGSDNDDDDDNGVVFETTPLPPQNEEDDSRVPVTYRQHCRRADEVEGGNFQFDWAFPVPGEIRRLSFNSGRNRARVDFEGVENERVEGTYTPVPADETQVGAKGSFRWREFTLFFPEVPPGTIRGSTREYLISELEANGTQLGTFLCPLSLENEFEDSP